MADRQDAMDTMRDAADDRTTTIGENVEAAQEQHGETQHGQPVDQGIDAVQEQALNQTAATVQTNGNL